MTAPPDDTAADTNAIIAALRTERDAGLAREAALVEELAARDATLAQRNTEYGERMDHQAATIDVLKVMSGTPGDPQPVFDLVVRRATELCNGLAAALYQFDGSLVYFRAVYHVAPDPDRFAGVAAMFPMAPTREIIACRAILDRRIVHIRDTEAEPGLSEVVRERLRRSHRSQVSIPLMRDGQVIGAISLGGKEPGGFTDSQIALLQTFAEQAVIAISSAETYRALQTRTSDLQETLEYQTATSDVLKVISRSTFDLQLVLDTVVETAARLCDADQAAMARPEGDFWRLVANFGFPAEYEAHYRATGAMPYGPDAPSVTARAVREKVPVHIHDVAAIPGYPDHSIRLGKQRTSLAVPLLREGQPIGAILLARQRVEPFTDRQIGLVSTFADQAVIAIENTRLITEQREALEQQTATAEVLEVINASPGNLVPVFDAMLEKAMRLCEASFGSLYINDSEGFRTVAARGVPAAYTEFRAKNPIGQSGGPIARLLESKQPVHVLDMKTDESYLRSTATNRALVDLGGGRTALAVPLLKDDVVRGIIGIYRQEVRAFSDKQIALLENFAAQAVIAIDNARLLEELRQRTDDLQESLEYQTATSDVLKVISRSTFDLQPVLETVVKIATLLCSAEMALIGRRDGERWHVAANFGFPPEYEAYERAHGAMAINPNSPSVGWRAVREQRVVHIHDVAAIPDYHEASIRLAKQRTSLGVPLLRDGDAVGVIMLARRRVEPFTERQIELVSTFADQAVIAIENTRLITEQREALEQQTATAEVLQVINASPGNLQPVFDTMLEKAMRLCGGAYGVLRSFDGERMHVLASRGVPSEYAGFLAQNTDPTAPGTVPMPGTALVRALQTGQPTQALDARESVGHTSGSPGGRAIADLGGARTILHVPLVKDEVAVGLFTIYRQELRGFSDKQTALLESFAAQAVIAMENARLLGELRQRTADLQESLEYQTATSDVLKVISRSTFDLQPVLDTVVETAARLCDADMAAIGRPVGNLWRLSANFGFPSEFEAHQQASHPLGPDSPTVAARAVREKVPVHIHDAAAVPGYADVSIRLGKQRTSLGVPLLREGEVIGYIVLARQRVEPFTDRQIELVSTFADQAVIAIENARLITEQHEALEQQTATAEVLQVINASPGDLTPVFDAMLEKAMRLCEAAYGVLRSFDGARLDTLASRGVPSEYAEFLARNADLKVVLGADSIAGTLGQALQTGQPRQILDVREGIAYKSRSLGSVAIADLGGARTILHVPLVKDLASVGLFTIYRQEVRGFSDKQIALVKNFAAQAVIAMENARLLTEQQEALEQQTATAEVLQIINSSPGNLAPVFDAILEKAHALCGAATGSLQLYDGEFFRAVATRGLPDEFANILRQPHRSGLLDALLRDVPFLQITDIADPALTGGDKTLAVAHDIYGVRTYLRLPLRKDDALLGAIIAGRREVRPFSQKEISLLQSFAAQAVIAMENARLLDEQREALEQQTATAEVLKVINASPGDLTPVFDAMLEKAMRLCEAAHGGLQMYDGERFWPSKAWGIPGLMLRPSDATPHEPGSALRRIVDGDDVVHLPDVMDTDAYRRGLPLRVRFVESIGARTALWVALRKGEALLGVFVMYRQEVQPFTDKQIALLQNFAAQAVIAMESARLLHELRARTDELAQRQTELRLTFENMGDGVAMFDETQHLVAWNRKFQDILDVPDVIIARRPTFQEYVRYLAERGEYGVEADPEDQVRRLAEQADQYRAYERTRPDGRVIEIRHNPVPGGGFVLIYADITERKRNEAEIRAARDAAEEASRTIEAAFRELKTAQTNLIQAEKMASLGQLTAGIAHEIKNPLNFVNNFAALSVDLLSELKEAAAPGFAALTDDQRTEIDDVSAMLTSNLEKITEHGKRADGIVKAMLEHSRGSSAERRMVDLNALIGEALNLAYHGARAQDQSFNITLEQDFGDGIAPIEVNPQDMTRVFLNIFSNGFYAANKRARNCGDAGFVPMLKVTTGDGGDAVEIRMRDNGTGIPVEIRDKLFQPFFTTKPTGEGTGLGLSITYDIVTKQHGGTITVDSEVDAFTEFVVTLPRQMFTNGGGRA